MPMREDGFCSIRDRRSFDRRHAAAGIMSSALRLNPHDSLYCRAGLIAVLAFYRIFVGA
jgi:hypothetical protein